jgi:hypothetical protein
VVNGTLANCTAPPRPITSPGKAEIPHKAGDGRRCVLRLCVALREMFDFLFYPLLQFNAMRRYWLRAVDLDSDISDKQVLSIVNQLRKQFPDLPLPPTYPDGKEWLK